MTWIRSCALDARLEMSARDVHRAGDVTLVPLVLLADVDHDGPSGLDQGARPRRVDLGDLRSDLLQQFPVVRHRFPKYSVAGSASVAPVGPKARVWAVVGASAVAAAGIAVGVTLATRSDVHRQMSRPPM